MCPHVRLSGVVNLTRLKVRLSNHITSSMFTESSLYEILNQKDKDQVLINKLKVTGDKARICSPNYCLFGNPV
jgi:hypothetical protein